MKIAFEALHERHRDGVLEILRHYTNNTTMLFTSSVLTEDSYVRMVEQLKGYPAYVGVDYENHKISGFCFLSEYSMFPAFRTTAEIGYYIAPDYIGKGIGSKCLDKLASAALERNITHLLAKISSENLRSIQFHKKKGFILCGNLRGIGEKCGRCFDVILMQKDLTPHPLHN